MVKWASIVVIAAGVLLLIRALPSESLQSAFKDWIRKLGFWGPAVFALVYVVATICLVPGSLLTLVAGAISSSVPRHERTLSRPTTTLSSVKKK